MSEHAQGGFAHPPTGAGEIALGWREERVRLGAVELAVAWAIAASLLGEPESAAVEQIEHEHITARSWEAGRTRLEFSPSVIEAIASSEREGPWWVWVRPLRELLLAECGVEWEREVDEAVRRGVRHAHERLLHVSSALGRGVVVDCRSSAAEELGRGFPWLERL